MWPSNSPFLDAHSSIHHHVSYTLYKHTYRIQYRQKSLWRATRPQRPLYWREGPYSYRIRSTKPTAIRNSHWIILFYDHTTGPSMIMLRCIVRRNPISDVADLISEDITGSVKTVQSCTAWRSKSQQFNKNCTFIRKDYTLLWFIVCTAAYKPAAAHPPANPARTGIHP